MGTKKAYFSAGVLILLCFTSILNAQIQPGIYFSKVENIVHELKIGKVYLIHTVYESTPAKFIKTIGGFYDTGNGILDIALEFNSDFEKDGVRTLKLPYNIKNNRLTLKTERPLVFEMQDTKKQDLDGQWLFATRGLDKEQKRRGGAHTRKTLKYLQDGRFQWIAYDTKGMQFKGTGGGAYTSQEGSYTEKIEFFSRDNSRVNAILTFDYELQDDDWHHKGKNSRGEPMYEIWSKRK